MRCRQRLRRLYVVLSFAAIQAKEPELPLCPTSMQYFPQNLPMHCRMPATLPPFPPQLFPDSAGKQPIPIPMPGPIPRPLMGPMPVPMPGLMPMPMPMAPVPPAPAQKLPVIVMPFYSQEPYIKNPHDHQGRPPRKHRVPKKKRRPKYYATSDEDSSDDNSSTDHSSDTSSERGWWKGRKQGRRSNRHHQPKRKKHQAKEVLTPILQYVTKDGYVIFEKQVSRGEAKDWLANKRENKQPVNPMNEVYPDYNEPKEEKGRPKFSEKDVEEIDVKTEKSPQQIRKKKILKRKPIKRHVDDSV